MLDFYTFSSQRAFAGDFGVACLSIARADDDEPRNIFKNSHVIRARAAKLSQNDPLLLRAHVVQTENSLHFNIQFCTRCFAAAAPGWHAFILEGKRLQSQELPAAGWR